MDQSTIALIIGCIALGYIIGFMRFMPRKIARDARGRFVSRKA